MKCENCKEEHDGSYGSGRFCDSKCARGFSTKNKRNEINEKVSKTLKSKPKKPKKHIYLSKTCSVCGSVFITHTNRASCSKKCAVKMPYIEDVNLKRIYKSLCKFNFNLSEFSDEFNFNLIKEYGWYSATNSKKPNLMGVSRDHKISVHNGFKFKIHPYIISHPVNCGLMQQNLNSKKKTNNSITIETLLENINLFNMKYKFKEFTGDVYITNEDIMCLYVNLHNN